MKNTEVLMSKRFRSYVLSILVLFVLVLFLFMSGSCASVNNTHSSGKIPVVFDTDIGDDIDDTWALALLLRSPEFDVKLITTAVGDTTTKAKVVAKMLQIAGRTDIPIGIGPATSTTPLSQKEWVKDYKLSKYPGTVYQDGAKALVDTIMNSKQRLKLIAVGPLPTVAAALKREPRIAQKVDFVGMHGSIRKGYNGKNRPDPEYNVVKYVKASQDVFTADWPMTITPLDTCGIVRLKGQKYQRVFNSKLPVTKALIEGYQIWAKNGRYDANKESSVLFDTVAIYLAMSKNFLVMETLPIKVTDNGMTVIEENAKKMNCATEWRYLDEFEDFLVERLTK
jgi:inosine-uridine nucleoside N-ribohydrolase